VESPALNYLGVLLAVISTALYFPIKPVVRKQTMTNSSESSTLINPVVSYNTIQDVSETDVPDVDAELNQKDDIFSKKRSPLMMKMVGIGLSVIAGFLYGINLIPVSILQQRYSNANALSFALSHFSGIFGTSTLILVVYCIIKKNRPQFFSRSLFPALVAGVLWAIAQAGWFIALPHLGMTISFPIISTGPGVVGSLWGVFMFKEISGKRNFILLSSAFLVTVSGILLIAFSKG